MPTHQARPAAIVPVCCAAPPAEVVEEGPASLAAATDVSLDMAALVLVIIGEELVEAVPVDAEPPDVALGVRLPIAPPATVAATPKLVYVCKYDLTSVGRALNQDGEEPAAKADWKELANVGSWRI